jgi:hypothetical protein
MKDPEQARSLLAVVFRYEAFPDMEADIDRRDCISKVGRLLQHVQQIVTQAEP